MGNGSVGQGPDLHPFGLNQVSTSVGAECGCQDLEQKRDPGWDRDGKIVFLEVLSLQDQK